VWDYSAVLARLLTGTPGADTMIGDGTNNTLDGGAGNDYLEGRYGDDVYVFGRGYGQDRIYDAGTSTGDVIRFASDVNVADVVVSRAGSWWKDLVLTIAGTQDRLTLTSYFTDAGGLIEEFHFADGTVWDLQKIQAQSLIGTDANETIVGFSGADRLEGHGGNDALYGNEGDDILDGGAGTDLLDGGIGADTLSGGAGNDTYVVDNAADVVIEMSGEGIDLVQSAVSFTLAANVENVTLTGTAAVNGTGNELDNVLLGNGAANVLIGAAGNDTLNGGAGADSLAGGLGDDVYVIDHAADVVTEAASEGTDTVQSAVSYTLADNVENLTLTGTAALNGTGNALNNVLVGNSAANTLNGGAGSDVLRGGTGSDTYQVGRGSELDTIQNGDSSTSLDRVLFGADIDENQIWLSRLGDDLTATIIGTNDRAVIQGWYATTPDRIDRFQTSATGRMLVEANVQQLVDAMAAFEPPPFGQTTLTPEQQAQLAPHIAAAWQNAA